MAVFFTYYEFIKSETATKLGIDNTPTDDTIQDNILELMRIMDKIREKWTEYCTLNCLPNPEIIITSGYRCNALNKAVGGSKTSAHRIGAACDFEANNGHNGELFNLIVNMIEKGEIKCSQLIWEKGDKQNPDWIHFALYAGGKLNQILKL